MPPRWPRKPDRNEPAFRRLEDRINFAVHFALFAAVNSGVWFFDLFLHQAWVWPLFLTAGWGFVMAAHAFYIFALIDYSKTGSV